MIEKQTINDRDVWIKVDAIPANRANPNIIPTEYFTASYYFNEYASDAEAQAIKDEDGEAKLFESPVAALSYVQKKIERGEV